MSDLPPPHEVLERAANAIYRHTVDLLDVLDHPVAARTLSERTNLLLDVERLIAANHRVGTVLAVWLEQEREANDHLAWPDAAPEGMRCSSRWGPGGATRCGLIAGHLEGPRPSDHFAITDAGGHAFWHDEAAWSHDIGGGRWATAEDAAQAELQRIANDPAPAKLPGMCGDIVNDLDGDPEHVCWLPPGHEGPHSYR